MERNYIVKYTTIDKTIEKEIISGDCFGDVEHKFYTRHAGCNIYCITLSI